MIGAGPGGEHRDRSGDPVLRLPPLWIRRNDPDRGQDHVPSTPAARRSEGRRDRRGRRPDAIPDLGTVARLEQFADDIGSHRCAGKQVDGCRAATPVTITVRRDGELKTIAVARIRRCRRTREDRLLLRRETIESRRSAPRPSTRSTPPGSWPSRTVSIFSRLFEEKQRKQLSGVVGVSDVPTKRSTPSAAETLTPGRRRQPLARADQPLPVPAARRRSHLLEPGREGPRQAGPVRVWSAPA